MLYLTIFPGTSTKDTLGFIGQNDKANARFLMTWVDEKVKYPASKISFRNVFNVQKQHFLVIALLYNSDSNPTNAEFEGKYRPLADDLYSMVTEKALDVVAIKGNQTPLSCPKLVDIFSRIVVTDYFKLFLDISAQVGKSYSFCGNIRQPNLQSHYHVAQASKGLENDCPGLNIDLVQQLPVFAGESTSSAAVRMFDMCGGRESSLETQSSQVRRFLERHNPDTECVSDDQNMATTDMQYSAIRTRKRNYVDDPRFNDFEWETTKNFQESWITQISNHQSHLLPIGEIRRIKNWFEYLPAPAGQEVQSRYRCRICHSNKKKSGYKRTLWVPKIAQPTGTLQPTLAENRKKLLDHEKSDIHTGIVNHLMKSKRAELEDLSHYRPGQTKPENIVTNRVMR